MDESPIVGALRMAAQRGQASDADPFQFAPGQQYAMEDRQKLPQGIRGGEAAGGGRAGGSVHDFANRAGLTRPIIKSIMAGKNDVQIAEELGGQLSSAEIRLIRNNLGIGPQ